MVPPGIARLGRGIASNQDCWASMDAQRGHGNRYRPARPAVRANTITCHSATFRKANDTAGEPSANPAVTTAIHTVEQMSGTNTTIAAIARDHRREPSPAAVSIILLAGRIGVGATFFKAGLLKYSSFEFTVRLFAEEYKVPLLDPAVAARIAMVQELTIPLLLFAGLATRIATLPLLGMIAVIQLSQRRQSRF